MIRTRISKTAIATICSLALILGFLPTSVFSAAGTALAETTSVSEVVYQLGYTTVQHPDGSTYPRSVKTYIYSATEAAETIAGVSFNKKTNTLTLNGVSATDKVLAIAGSTSDFTINVKGTNKLAGIDYSNCYGTTLKITGNGTLSLTIDYDVSNEGIALRAGKLSVDPTVTLNIGVAKGIDTDSAALIYASVFSMQKTGGFIRIDGQLTPSTLKVKAESSTYTIPIWAYWDGGGGVFCKKDGKYYASKSVYASTSDDDEEEEVLTGYDVYPVMSSSSVADLSKLDTALLGNSNIEVEVGTPTHIDAVVDTTAVTDDEDDDDSDDDLDYYASFVPEGYEMVAGKYYTERIRGTSLTHKGTATSSSSATTAKTTKTKVKTVTINVQKVTASALNKAVKKLNTSKKTASTKTITSIVLGAKVKGISKKAFAKYTKAKTLTVKTKKLTKESVKNSLKGSKVTTVKVKVSSKAKTNKKYVKTYKKYFAKANSGKKVTAKAA